WDFYNSDGGVAEMCGNASRCVARFALENNIADRSASFETLAGVVSTRVRPNGMVEVDMPHPKIISELIEVKLGDNEVAELFYLDTGVPHVVKENSNWDDAYLHELGSFLCHHQKFEKTNGANIT